MLTLNQFQKNYVLLLTAIRTSKLIKLIWLKQDQEGDSSNSLLQS